MLINIPDKICPHCGGTKYFFNLRKETNRVRETYKCTKMASENSKKWKINHPIQYKELLKKRCENERVSGYRKTESYRKLHNKIGKRNRQFLTDKYIKQIICVRTIFKHKDIPQDLIELKRKQLKLKRYVKENSNK